ncbi:hypothetical protein Leryth_000102 [Lithospermum erythrorhizon]|nr:hypothetical protein Leryth_000102 [Lithospermum erythrorhizon]
MVQLCCFFFVFLQSKFAEEFFGSLEEEGLMILETLFVELDEDGLINDAFDFLKIIITIQFNFFQIKFGV